MNCKPGDLAIIVGHTNTPESLGQIVLVTKMITSCGQAAWFFEPPFKTKWIALDRHLRPIRDNPGADETLSWKQAPSKEHA